MTDSAIETVTFTREEFYEYVWTAPATQLAKELGCSDVMLGKVCKSYDVPKPYSGYWAKLAHGKSPEKTPLPKCDDNSLQQIVFHKYPQCETTVDEPPPESRFDEDIQSILNKCRRLKPIKVATSLRSPHSLIVDVKDEWKSQDAEATMTMEQRLRYMDRERKRTIDIQVSKEQRSRALRIMDAFIKRVERLGGSVEVHSSQYYSHRRHTVVKLGGEEVTQIRLREKNNQVKTVNKNEKYDWLRNKTELIPSGLLLIDEGPSYRGPLLKDKKNLKIEDQLTSFVEKLIVNSGEIRISRRVREEKERQRLIEERVRQERQELIRQAREDLGQLQQLERSKVEDLFNRAKSWKDAQVLREYLDALSVRFEADPKHDQELCDYIKWGFDQADRLDPFCESPSSVLDEVVNESDEKFRVKKPR